MLVGMNYAAMTRFSTGTKNARSLLSVLQLTGRLKPSEKGLSGALLDLRGGN